MIILQSNDSFLDQSIYSLLKQKNLVLIEGQSEYKFIINIKNYNNKLNVLINNNSYDFKLPLNFNRLMNKIIEELLKCKIDFKNISYFPYQRVIENDQKQKLNLSDIQNSIFLFLFNKENGVDKDSLYRKIWHHDADISMNKLDTHLTNLKNQLQKKLNLNISFQSYNKSLRLIIN